MYLVDSGTPLYATQRPSFRTMLEEFGISLRSRQYLESTVLPAIYTAVMKNLQERLSTVDSISVSFDGWKKSGNLHVLGQVYTYITPNWEYHADLVRIIPVIGSPSGTHLQTLINFGLRNLVGENTLVAACVTDNEASYLSAARSLADNLGCSCHSLELCIEDVCWKESPEVKSILEMVLKL